MADQHYSIPPGVLSIADYQQQFESQIAPEIHAYFESGCGLGSAPSRNRSAFSEYSIVSRILRKVAHGDTAVSLSGQKFSSPILLGPVAHQGLLHPRGELETAAAAEALGVGMVCSTLSSVTLESVAQVGAKSWFQLYWQGNRDTSLDLIRRAEKAGYTSIVMTVDVPVQAMRYDIQRSGFILPPDAAVNLKQYSSPDVSVSATESAVFQGVMATAPNWEDVEWLISQTSLPFIIKGVLHPDDAVMAKQAGGSGVVVSNHGGRALDSLISPLAVLSDVRAAVGSEYLVLMDGGIRSGEDVFKALALGANAVLIGRPQVYGLAVAGALGVAHVVKILQEELEVTMSLCGCDKVSAIGSQHLHSRRPQQLESTSC